MARKKETIIEHFTQTVVGDHSEPVMNIDAGISNAQVDYLKQTFNALGNLTVNISNDCCGKHEDEAIRQAFRRVVPMVQLLIRNHNVLFLPQNSPEGVPTRQFIRGTAENLHLRNICPFMDYSPFSHRLTYAVDAFYDSYNTLREELIRLSETFVTSRRPNFKTVVFNLINQKHNHPLEAYIRACVRARVEVGGKNKLALEYIEHELKNKKDKDSAFTRPVREFLDVIGELRFFLALLFYLFGKFSGENPEGADHREDQLSQLFSGDSDEIPDNDTLLSLRIEQCWPQFSAGRWQ